MPRYNYFFELTNCCLEKLASRNHLPHPYTTEKALRLERDLIANAKTVFCRFLEEAIGSAECKRIKTLMTLECIGGEYTPPHSPDEDTHLDLHLRAIISDYDTFLLRAACYIREQLLQAHSVPAPNNPA
jgi:hypothetical protein